jgi:hypothetical protein
VNLCLAIDESGSICTRETVTAASCTSCGCRSDGTCQHRSEGYYYKTNDVCDCDTDCPRFNTDTKNFATGFIAQFAQKATQNGATQTQFSVVSFATKATERTGLTTAANAASAVDSLTYTGGWTNTEEALQKCQATLPNTDPTTKNVILLFTDGTPTKCTETSSTDGHQNGAYRCTQTGCACSSNSDCPGRHNDCERPQKCFGSRWGTEYACANTINWCSGTTTPWEDDVCTKYADKAATTIEGTGTKIATLFVQTTNDCPSNKQGPGTRTTPGCYPGSAFLQNRIASSPDLAQEANWGDVNALVGTMADQIVAGIC